MSGKQALQLIDQRIEEVKTGKAEMYNLVLLDYSMPEMNGTEVAEQIRSKL